MKRGIIFFALIFLALLTCSSNAFTQEQSIEVVVSRLVKTSFEPKEAFFILNLNEEVQKVPVKLWITDPNDTKTEGSDLYRYFGTLFKLPATQESFQEALLILGNNGEGEFFPFKTHQTVDDVVSNEELLNLLQKQKEAIESWRVQLRVQSESLERLRSDAEIIGNLGKIAEKTTELQRMKIQRRNLDRDMENLKRFIKIAGKTPKPHNFTRRQNMLTEQLEEIAKAAKAMEAGERDRKNQSESELQQQLHMVEETRDEDYDALRERLKALRQEKVALEDSYMR